MSRLAALVAALLVAACTKVVVVSPGEVADVGVATALKHTIHAGDLGCTAVDVGRGMVVTAKHCVDELDAGTDTDEGYLVYKSVARDFAVLFDTGRLDAVRACMRAPKFGEHLYAVGYPAQLAAPAEMALTVTDGVFAGPTDESDGSVRITAPIWFGNSGGGVWADDGCLLGISVSGFLQVPGMNYMVASPDIVPWLPRK